MWFFLYTIFSTKFYSFLPFHSFIHERILISILTHIFSSILFFLFYSHFFSLNYSISKMFCQQAIFTELCFSTQYQYIIIYNKFLHHFKICCKDLKQFPFKIHYTPIVTVCNSYIMEPSLYSINGLKLHKIDFTRFSKTLEYFCYTLTVAIFILSDLILDALPFIIFSFAISFQLG